MSASNYWTFLYSPVLRAESKKTQIRRRRAKRKKKKKGCTTQTHPSHQPKSLKWGRNREALPPRPPKWDAVVSLYLPKLYSAVGRGCLVLRKWWIKSEGLKLLQFHFFPPSLPRSLALPLQPCEKSKPGDVFQKLHDSLFGLQVCFRAHCSQKNPLKNSLQSHTAAFTNVIYIGPSSALLLLFYLFVLQRFFFSLFPSKHNFISQLMIALMGTILHFFNIASHTQVLGGSRLKPPACRLLMAWSEKTSC